MLTSLSRSAAYQYAIVFSAAVWLIGCAVFTGVISALI